MSRSERTNGAGTQRVRAGRRGVQHWILRATARHVVLPTAEAIASVWLQQRSTPRLIAGALL